MVTKGSRVTIWCQGSLQAEAYSLFDEHESRALDTRVPQDSSKKTGFVIERMSSTTARRYQCAYYTRKNSWSELSDPLSLVVTGKSWVPSTLWAPPHRQKEKKCVLRGTPPLTAHTGVRGVTVPLQHSSLLLPQAYTMHPPSQPSQAPWWPQERTCPSHVAHRLDGALSICLRTEELTRPNA